MTTIQIQPDAVAIIATRLAKRLKSDGLLDAPANRQDAKTRHNEIIEALADELHLDIIDRMTGVVR